MKFIALEELLPEIQDDKFYAAWRSGNNYRGSGNSTHFHWNIEGPFDSEEEAKKNNFWVKYTPIGRPNKLGKGSGFKRLMRYDNLGGEIKVTGNVFLGFNPDGGPI